MIPMQLWFACAGEPSAVPDPPESTLPIDSGVEDTGVGCVPDDVPNGTALLTLNPFGPYDQVPDSSRPLSVFAVIHGGNVPVVQLCQAWSIDPPTAGISIDADGLLTVGPDVPDGTEVSAVALVPVGAIPDEDEKVRLTVPIFVYDPSQRPWVGTWREVAQVDCVTGEERVPEQPIEEFKIRANGDINVTWVPFELYIDYWATGEFDLLAGTVSVVPQGGNYVPSDVDGDGTFAMDADALLLTDLWLGSPSDAVVPAGCGHRFE